MLVKVTGLSGTLARHQIRVSVTDATTTAPIAGASVQVFNSNTGALEASGTTAANGTVTLSYNRCGEFDPETRRFIPAPCDGSANARGYSGVSFVAP